MIKDAQQSLEHEVISQVLGKEETTKTKPSELKKYNKHREEIHGIISNALKRAYDGDVLGAVHLFIDALNLCSTPPLQSTAELCHALIAQSCEKLGAYKRASQYYTKAALTAVRCGLKQRASKHLRDAARCHKAAHTKLC